MEKSTYRSLTKKSDQNRLRTVFSHQTQTLPAKRQILNGHAIENYFHRIRRLDFTLSSLLIVQIILLYCYYELDLIGYATAKWFLRGGEICGAFGFAVIIARHLQHKQQQAFIGEQPQGQRQLLLRIFIFLIMPFEFSDSVYMNLTHVDDTSDIEIRVQYTQKLNHLLIILTFLRMCYFVSTVLIRSRYLSPSSIRISTMRGFYPGMVYCIKSIFKDHPFSFILGIYAFTFTMFTIAFRITENVIYNNTPSDIYTNMAWMTVITMTTVGYGDYAPKTSLGRLIGLFCISSGVLIMAIMVVVLTRTFSMNKNQSQTLHILKKLEANSDLKEAAGEYLRQSVWRRWQNKKLKQNRRQNLSERKMLLRFKAIKSFCESKKTMEADMDYFNEIQRQFERAFTNLNSLKETNRLIMKHINDEFVIKKEKALPQEELA